MNSQRLRRTTGLLLLSLTSLIVTKFRLGSLSFTSSFQRHHVLTPQQVQRTSNPLIRYAADAGEVGDGKTTPAMLAAYTGDAAAVRGLVAEGADLDAQDAYGWTALRYAVRANHEDCVSTIIELGANIDLASASGRTPLMSAAGNGLSHMIRLLIKSGADRTLKNTAGQTAYDISLRGGSTGCTACREMLAFEDHEVVKVAL